MDVFQLPLSIIGMLLFHRLEPLRCSGSREGELDNNVFERNLGVWILKYRKAVPPYRNATQYKAMFKAGNVGHHVYNAESALETGEAEPGDLCLIPLELFLASSNSSIQFLPDTLAVKFVHVDLTGNIKPKTGHGIYPSLNLFCVVDLDGYLELTQEDYEESLHSTKLWKRNSQKGGLWNYDYITKYSFHDNDPKNVDLFLVNWSPTDLISVVPGVVEVRTRRNWFYGDTVSQNMYDSLSRHERPSQEIELPVVGLVGTVLKTKVVYHSYDKNGNVVVGSQEKSTFFQVLLKDRIPVWVQGPVWKCPDELILPVYLPVP